MWLEVLESDLVERTCQPVELRPGAVAVELCQCPASPDWLVSDVVESLRIVCSCSET